MRVFYYLVVIKKVIKIGFYSLNAIFISILQAKKSDSISQHI